MVEQDSPEKQLFSAAALREDLGYPVYLFDAWVKHFDLKHAAILVLDENESLFLPSAYIGFDSTTRRRLRIPRAIIDQHSAFETKGRLSLTGEDRIILEPFFSVREFGIFSRMNVIGVRHNDSTYALLLSARDEEERDDGSPECEPLKPEYGAALFSSYCSKFAGLPSLPYYDDTKQAVKSLEAAVIRHRETGRFIHFCRVDLKALLEVTRPRTPTIDIYRFREDVLRILHSFVSAAGLFYEEDENEVILGFATAAAQDCGFLASHLHLSIGDFFPQTTLPDSIIKSHKSVRPDEKLDSPAALFD